MNKLYCRAFQRIMRFATYFLPWRKPQLLIGENKTSEIANIFQQKNINSVLLVTTEDIIKFKLHENTITSLKKQKINCTIYDKVIPNPTIDCIEDGVNMYRNNNCNGIIAIGGGSAIDCAKGIAMRIVNPHKTIQQMRGLLKVKHNMPTFIAVPTTAGTGSETTIASVITDSKTHEKYAVNDIHLIPHYAILDPTLTLSLPKMLTATTGMDALTHAVEAYIGHSNTKKTKQCAEEAVKIIFEYLPKAVKDGKNVEYREQMLRASFLAGVAFTRAYVGNVHAIAHTLGGQYDVPHGLANAVILPYVLEYYGKTIYKSIDKLCKKANLFLEITTPKEKTEKFIKYIKDMNKQFGIDNKIEQLKEEDIPLLVPRAMKEANPLYPVPMIFDNQDFTNIYKQLLKDKK